MYMLRLTCICACAFASRACRPLSRSEAFALGACRVPLCLCVRERVSLCVVAGDCNLQCRSARVASPEIPLYLSLSFLYSYGVRSACAE